MKTLLRFFFKLLYHQFAFAYDLVAATVSVGRWKDWVSSVLPFLAGTRILEIGFGPGHLQRLLLSRSLIAVGIDESSQMARLAKRNLSRGLVSGNVHAPSPASHRSAYTQGNLTRGLGQALPFRDGSFDSIVATFPAEYITEPETLLEVKRCLSDGGRFIVLPVALQMGRGVLERAMSLLFRITRQAPVDPIDVVKGNLTEPFIEAGFEVEVQELEAGSSLLLVIVAKK
jgi:ubiquinone/menaquinone biosynthesis C-methylase UbiE